MSDLWKVKQLWSFLLVTVKDLIMSSQDFPILQIRQLILVCVDLILVINANASLFLMELNIFLNLYYWLLILSLIEISVFQLMME